MPPLETAATWQCISVQHTLVHPPGMEPDRAIVAAVRRFDPRYIPLWVRKTYIAPTGGDWTMGYHVIGRFVRERDEMDTAARLGPPVRLQVPPSTHHLFGFEYPGPGRIWAQRTWSLGWPKGSLAKRLSWPDLYLELDDEFLSWARAAYRFMFDERWPIASRVRDMDREAAEVERRYLERLSTEAKYKLTQEPVREAARRELHRMEHPQQYTDHLPPVPKPTVDLGATGAA